MPVTNPEEALDVWLKKKGHKVASGSGAEWTHSSLIGGVFNIRTLGYFLEANSAKGRDVRDVTQLSKAEIDARYRQQETQFLKHYARTTCNIIYRKAKLTGSNGTIHRPLIKEKMNFISEKITPIFKYFIDLDFASKNLDTMYGYSSETTLAKRISKITKRLANSPRGTYADKARAKLEFYNSIFTRLKHQQLLQKVRLIQTTIKEFYPGLESRNPKAFQVLVCLTTPKELKNDGYGEGVHLVFPYIQVNREQALDIRANMIHRLEAKFQLDEEANWHKIFDEGVYGENSGALRMLGSRKANPCSCNKRKNRAKTGTKEVNCKLCDNHRYIWTSRIYWPEYMLASNGDLLVEELASLLDPETMIPNPDLSKPRRKDNLFRLISLTSLRTFSSQPLQEFRIPTGAVRHIPSRPNTRRTKRGKGAAAGETEVRQHDEDAKTLSGFRNKRALVNDHPWFQLFEKLIARKFGDVYKNVQISQTFLIPDKKHAYPWFLICVSGPGSNFCLNLNGDHASNTVYFIINESGIRQKCHCKCEVLRPSGIMCKDYTSETKSLRDVPLFYGLLFPPLYHGTVWTMPSNLKYGSMPVGFTDVLWNRITRLKPISLMPQGTNPDDANPNPDTDITQGDSTLTESMIKQIITEISGSDPSAKAAPENLILEAQLRPDAPINPEPYSFMQAQTEM